MEKQYTIHDLMPSSPIHPGEMLKDELQARGISQRKFAEIIGMPYTALNELANGKRNVSTDIALKIEAATEIKAYIWMNMQVAYSMQIAQKDNKLKLALEQIRKAVAVF